MPVNSVAFVHAHPDDEALLSGGTLRALHQKGIRTIVIFLTNGQRGMSERAISDELGVVRQREALTSAQILGVGQTYFLGFEDSGLFAENEAPTSLTKIPLEVICDKLQAILDVEKPTVVIGYDAQGGYGHPDHKVVHHVVRQLSETTQIPTFLEVTVDRSIIAFTLDRFRHLISLMNTLRLVRQKDVFALSDGFSASADIQYRINVQSFCSAKRSALKAHHSQTTGGVRNIGIMTLLPRFIFKRLFGIEWFVSIREAADNPLKSLASSNSISRN